MKKRRRVTPVERSMHECTRGMRWYAWIRWWWIWFTITVMASFINIIMKKEDGREGQTNAIFPHVNH